MLQGINEYLKFNVNFSVTAYFSGKNIYIFHKVLKEMYESKND